jgi:hypothetical protein
MALLMAVKAFCELLALLRLDVASVAAAATSVVPVVIFEKSRAKEKGENVPAPAAV